MALVSCGECGHQVSSTAISCPKCGAPRQAPPAVVLQEARKGTSPWTIIGWIILIILLLPLATCFMVVGSGAMSDYDKRLEERRQSK